MRNAQRFSQEDKAFISVHYPQWGSKRCAEHVGCPTKWISDFASKQGLHVDREIRKKNWSEALIKARASIQTKCLDPERYRVDPRQFQDVTTPEAAYILGLLWADGNINRDLVRIQCVRKDLETLKWVFMKTGDWSIGYSDKGGNRKEQMVISTYCRQFRGLLEDNDYHVKSTAPATKILSRIPEHLKHYWWRGLVDGDGCFYVDHKRGHCQLSITSSYEQDWSFVLDIMKGLEIESCKIQRDDFKRRRKDVGRSSVARMSGRHEITTFARYIYQGYETDKIGLKRKHDKWLEIERLANQSIALKTRGWKRGVIGQTRGLVCESPWCPQPAGWSTRLGLTG